MGGGKERSGREQGSKNMEEGEGRSEGERVSTKSDKHYTLSYTTAHDSVSSIGEAAVYLIQTD